MSVLARAGEDAWAGMTVDLEDEDAPVSDTTPLNSREPSPNKPAARHVLSGNNARARVQPERRQTALEMAAADRGMHDTGRMGADLRRSRLSNALIGLFFATLALDALTLLEVLDSINTVDAAIVNRFGENTRAFARLGQIITLAFTLALAAYSLITHRRWQVSVPRTAAAAATQFALLPEYTTIALFLDVGKLAYPHGNRAMLVALTMLVRIITISILLRLSFIAGVRRGLVSQKQMPEMLRTLVSLEGVETRGLADVAPQAERPLTVDLLEKLVVFLTPRRLGDKPKEGAGLSRNSAMPLAIFAFLLTAAASFTEYDRLRSSQEPQFESHVAQLLYEESMLDLSTNSSARLRWRPPSIQPVPPVSTFLVIVSGVNFAVGSKILGRAFDPSVNPICALDVQTRCESYVMKNVVPSRSLPNWVGSLTGASPTVTGVLDNFAVGNFPFDTIFAQARAYGVDTGASTSPWLINLIKPDLPLLTGDGRTSSSADGTYETTRPGGSLQADVRRRAATLYAARINSESVPIGERTRQYPSRYGLFVTQLTNVDSIGHKRGSASGEYEDAMRDVANFVLELMEALPPNSVLIVGTDHGHEAKGGAGGTSDVVSRTPMYSFRKTVSFGASNLEIDELARAAAATSVSTTTSSDTVSADAAATTTTATADATDAATDAPPTPPAADGAEPASTVVYELGELSTLDMAPTLALLSGLPIPRHAEGGFMPRMFANARREMWPLHARDLLYQRYHYARVLINYETLNSNARLRSIEDIEQDANARIAVSGGTALEQAVAWLQAAGEVQATLTSAKDFLALRYAMRNLLVSTALGGLIIALVLYVLHVMTFADPFFLVFYRRYAKSKHRSFRSLPDAIALGWALGIVGAYYLITITVYLVILQVAWGYSAFDASHVHDTFSQRRYFIATLVPGSICQWALTRSFTIYYKRPFAPPPRQSSTLLAVLRWTVKVRLIFSAQVESREVAKVYLIRLYLAAVSIFAIVIIFVASATASFPLPYIYQPKHIDPASWDARFQTLTYKILSMPLLLGAIYNLHLWGGTKLTVTEVEALYALKRRKEARMLGVTDADEEAEEEVARRAALAAAGDDDAYGSIAEREGGAGGALTISGMGASAAMTAEEEQQAEEEAMLRALVRKKLAGELTVEGLQEVEHLLLRTRTQTMLLAEKHEELHRRVDHQLVERSEALGAVRSSKAFLGRGFRDIEMLLEAGFRELEDQRSSFMANRRKKLRQRIEKDRARRAQRTAGYTQGGLENVAGATGSSAGGNKGNAPMDDGRREGEEESDSEDGESIASFDSDALQGMDFDELQARLAANEAKERKGFTPFASSGEKQALTAEAEAADIRRTEYASLAQSKMGKQAQLDELTARVAKEQATAASAKERLEAVMAEEQQVLQEWEQMDTMLQEAELERATLVASKTKAKELALEKAQVAESGLEGLKEQYRELRRREEKMLREVREAEQAGEALSKDLDMQTEAMRRERSMWLERIGAAENDRKLLFGEAQEVEHAMRKEKERMHEAQADAGRYREIFKGQM